MESVISLFGTEVRGDFFLVIASLVFGVFAFIIGAFRSRRSPTNDLSELLSKPEVIDALNTGADLNPLIEHLKKEDSSQSKGFIGIITEKIVNDIEWDIAGVIDMLVTVVLLFMVVSGTIDQAPEPIFTGWLLILGYYFGKGGKK